VVALVASGCGSDSEPDATTTTVLATSSTQELVSTTTTQVTATVDYDLQGHRGARGLRPENTLPSFEAALDVLVTTLEADLHFTADGEVVVWHDPEVDASKCSLGPAAPAALPSPDDSPRVRSLTAAQLLAYSCDRNPDSGRYPRQLATPGQVAAGNYGIVTLGELFDFVEDYAASPDKTEAQRANASTVLFNIETKRVEDEPFNIDDGFDGTNAGPFELAVLAAVEAAGTADRTTIQSFDHRSLWAIAAEDTPVRLAALTFRNLPDFDELAQRGADIWSPRSAQVSPASLGNAHAAGLLVIPWTINDPDDMQQLLNLGVDGIITDRPDLAPGR